MVHVAGTHMMSQGTDGVSRDSLMEGVWQVVICWIMSPQQERRSEYPGMVWVKELGLPHAGGMVCGRVWHDWRLPS